MKKKTFGKRNMSYIGIHGKKRKEKKYGIMTEYCWKTKGTRDRVFNQLKEVVRSIVNLSY
jgi:hypothetical protein